MSYTFTSPDNSMVLRNDGAFIPWDATGPRDKGGSVFKRWQTEGSPVPAAYVAPPPTTEEIIRAALLGNVNRQNIVAAIQAADPTTLDVAVTNYVNNNVTDLASARAMLVKLALLVVYVIRS